LSTTFSLNMPSDIVWNWQTEYQLTLFTNFGSTSASGADWYVEGSHVTISATPPSSGSGDQYFWNGWTGAGNSSFSGLTASPTLTIDSPVNETASWIHQFYLTVVSDHGSATPSTGWINAGTEITERLTESPSTGSTGTQYVCTGWTGTGDVPVTGTSLSIDFTVNNPSTVAWNWKTQFQLTVSSIYSSASGAGWYDIGSSTYASIAENTVSGNAGTRYLFTGWGGDASGSDLNSSLITMDGPKTAVANWQIQYYLSVTSTFGTTGGTGWYASGLSTYASLNNASLTEPDGSRYLFAGWSGDASGADYSQSNVIRMNGPKTVTAEWTEALVALTILSPLGNLEGYTTPSTGIYPQNDTSSITATATANNGYTFDHWMLDDQNVSSNPVIVSMNTDHTLEAYFQPINFTLTIVSSDGGYTDLEAGSYSYSYGTNVTVQAYPNEGYDFDHWLLSGVNVTSNPITLTVGGNCTIEPFYTLTPITPVTPSGSSSVVLYVYVICGVIAIAVAAFAVFVIVKRRT
jgi:hypothetical protein